MNYAMKFMLYDRDIVKLSPDVIWLIFFRQKFLERSGSPISDRKAGAFWHHGGPLKNPLHHGIMVMSGIRGAPQSGPHYAEGISLSCH